MDKIRKMNKQIEQFKALTSVPGLIGEDCEYKNIAAMLKSQHEFVENSPNFVNRLITVALQKEITENINKQFKEINQFGQELKTEVTEDRETAY